jgi:serine/threonine protein kinase
VSDDAEQLARLKAALAERYRVERELGHGGMATVYLAQDLKLDRQVALKVLRPDLAAALGSERFLREVRITARLNHPHILPLLDSGEADGVVYYTMPYVEGEPLRDRLEREKQLPLDDALQIAREVADALSYAHSHHVVHRDIKPENILLESGHAVVADFGIARAITAAGGERLTETGIAVGTPAYMSPEQAMGEKAIDARADIYAFGAVIYEMLTGEPPFTGATVQSILARVMSEEPRAIASVRKSVPPHVEAAVFKALAKLPADRWAGANDLAKALLGSVSRPIPQPAARRLPGGAGPWQSWRRLSQSHLPAGTRPNQWPGASTSYCPTRRLLSLSAIRRVASATRRSRCRPTGPYSSTWDAPARARDCTCAASTRTR